MAKIIVIKGPLKGCEFTILKGKSFAGRNTDCAIILPDTKTSRIHAEFDNFDQEVSITDKNSINGTFVNGMSLESERSYILKSGDEISIGQNLFRFFLVDTKIPDINIPSYTLKEVIAEGGMGIICRAVHNITRREVAIKILQSNYLHSEEFINRFIQEARAAGKLKHPNIIHVFNVGKSKNGIYYFIMELVKGNSLNQLINKLTTEQLLFLSIQISDALSYAHQHGIIHRDIKPDNILINQYGDAKITDLGIALLDHSENTTDGLVLGTPHYMSPEQATGNFVDSRSDLYSLGAMLYHLLSGQTLFDSSSAKDIMTKQVWSDPIPLETLCPDIPKELANIINKCLSKDPKKRFHSAIDLRNNLLIVFKKYFPTSEAPHIITSTPSSRNNFLTFCLFLLVILSIILFLFFYFLSLSS